MSDSQPTGASAQLELLVRQIRHEGRGINSYELVHPDGDSLPPFDAGAHIDVHIPGGLIRQYSICSSPSERYHYVIAVLRDEKGRGGSRSLHESWRVQQRVAVSAPRNHFPLGDRAARVILLAGGIGITPLKSMAHVLSAQDRDFELHYCARDQSATAFREELLGLEADGKVHYHFDHGNPADGLDIAALLRTQQPGTEIYYCGPAGFMAACARAAEHWPRAAVHCEHFKAPDRPMDAVAAAPAGSFQVQIASSGQMIQVGPDESIASALEDAGVGIETSCVSGLCGTCRLGYLSGDVEHNDFILDDAERSRYLTACVSRSKSALLVLDL